MTCHQSQQLSRVELVEIILQDQVTVLQQQALIDQLLARVATLADQIERLTQPPKDASNSSTPPSKTRKPNRPERKSNAKRGPKPGHEGRRRDRAAEVFAAQVAQIERACDALLSTTAPGRHGRRLQKRYRRHREALFTFL